MYRKSGFTLPPQWAGTPALPRQARQEANDNR
ncbi:protein of unknown function [Cupriavidus taiwanensis]|nr:protein of unknown function [Cupriavidus taiwanensis]